MIQIRKMNHSNELLKEIACLALLREPSNELGYRIYSDEYHTWYLAYDNGNLVGFCAAIKKPSHVSFSHDYVAKEHRNKGVYSRLFTERLKDFNSNIKAACTEMSLSCFTAHGFSIIKTTKNYTFVQKL